MLKHHKGFDEDEADAYAGDEVLIAVGERLTSCTRAADTVARLGGDEFAVLVGPRTTSRGVERLADRLAAAFRRPFQIADLTFIVGASTGRAVFPTDADSGESLLRAADTAMFECKRASHEAAPGPAHR